MNEYKYVGFELDLISTAHNWNSYWSQQIREFLRGDILDVGASAPKLIYGFSILAAPRWVCLEPDPQLIVQLVKALKKAPRGRCEPVCGTLQLLAGPQFNTIIYIDILEHIKDDREEMNRAASHLRPGGHLTIQSSTKIT
jgi:hypothetical protein